MQKKIKFYKLLLILILAGGSLSCSRLNPIGIFNSSTPREIYYREFSENSSVLSKWIRTFESGLSDSVSISLPYTEYGHFRSDRFAVYNYETLLKQGERLQVDLQTDSIKPLIFIEVFQRVKKDTSVTWKRIAGNPYGTLSMETEISESGQYKVLIQPAIRTQTRFSLLLNSEPIYGFPVVSKGNSAIQSFWGASRDAGKRQHEGIDIFATRGTPVIAVTEGRITSTGNRGLGGKQVWLRDRKRGNSLYYAHLDSILTTPGKKVSPGDTLGLVGNSGNARTTPPHLHFGIYQSHKGAQDPLPYVFSKEKPNPPWLPKEHSVFIVSKARANLRKGPTTRAPISATAQVQDTLRLLGRTSNWYHAQFQDQNIFIHQSLATPL